MCATYQLEEEFSLICLQGGLRVDDTSAPLEIILRQEGRRGRKLLD
jgi:hypothetical protein